MLTRWERTWDPFRELEVMSDRLNRLFATAPTREPKEGLREFDWAPSCNISETETAYQIQAELPETKREDVHVSVEAGVLTIQGERKAQKEEKGKKFHRVESTYGSFMRSFTLPENADDARIEASFKDGMLNVLVPKSTESKPKSRRITVGG